MAALLRQGVVYSDQAGVSRWGKSVSPNNQVGPPGTKAYNQRRNVNNPRMGPVTGPPSR
jgi:hypothetical protein